MSHECHMILSNGEIKPLFLLPLCNMTLWYMRRDKEIIYVRYNVNHPFQGHMTFLEGQKPLPDLQLNRASDSS